MRTRQIDLHAQTNPAAPAAVIGRTVTQVRDMIQPRLLGGRYELEGIVGRGGMAEVFRARDIRLDRVVGVKALRTDLARDQAYQARFRREAQSAASLNHPSIVAAYDTGEEVVGDISVPYIVMEFVDGPTLSEMLRDNWLPPEQAAEITDGVLTALDYSHRNGIVHRDIKPGNVMLTRSGDVKVMDFGIARTGSDARLTHSSQVMGTALYMSPEQAQGERVDARSDLYSTGCLLYELLTGQPVFTGETPMAIAYRHVTEDPVPPSRIAPEVPAWADAIVLKALQKDPAQRYQSAGEMRNDIERALAGAPVAAPGRAPAAAPKRTGWPWVALAVVITLAVAFVGVKLLTGGTNVAGATNGAGTSALVRVPSVTAGMPQADAKNLIKAAGLRVKISSATSSKFAANDVISMTPHPGKLVAKNSVVSLVVSTGPGPLASPSEDRHGSQKGKGHSTSPAPQHTTAPASGSGSPPPPPPSPAPSPSSTCIVNLIGICV